MWWFVSTSPSDETNEPDPPLLNRTDASRRWSSHASVTSKPYLFLISSRGTLLKTHMPSSARTACAEAAATAPARSAHTIRRSRIGPRDLSVAQDLVGSVTVACTEATRPRRCCLE